WPVPWLYTLNCWLPLQAQIDPAAGASNRCNSGWGRELLARVMNYQNRSGTINGLRPLERRSAKLVLIVEDNELNMKLFHDLLDAHGYATLQTRHGMEALELARKHRPDLIVMDIQLPEVSGLEVTK